MGQIISNLFQWIFPKKNETQRNDHHHHHHQQTKYQTFSSHNITIPKPKPKPKPKPNHPLLLSHNNKIENEGNHDDNNNIIINSNNNNNNNNNVPIIIPDDVVLVDMNISGYKEVAKRKVRRKKKKKEANIKDGNNNGDVDEEQLMIRPCWESRGIEEVSRAGKIGPYTSEQRLLLVGEGDFSFAACLAIAFGTSAVNIVATSLNSTNYLTKNYAMFDTNKAELESRGSMVLHEVDATTMMKHHILGSNNMLFDRIIFNFPHARNFCSTEIRLHQKLIIGFLRNAKEMIKENGEIHITAKSNGCFLEWDIPKLGSDNGLNLLQQLKFKRSKYRGYNPKYGYGGDRNLDCNPSKTYKFGLPSK